MNLTWLVSEINFRKSRDGVTATRGKRKKPSRYCVSVVNHLALIANAMMADKVAPRSPGDSASYTKISPISTSIRDDNLYL